MQGPAMKHEESLRLAMSAPRGADRARERGGAFNPFWLLPVLILVPDALAPEIADIRLNPLHVFLAAFALPAIQRLMRGGMLPCDWIFLAYAFWAAATRALNVGPVQAMNQFLETAVIYVFVIAYVRSPSDILRYVKTILVAVMILSMFAMVESVTGQRPIAELLRAIDPEYGRLLGHEYRAGFLRAGVYTHPITFGLFCGSMIAMVWYTQSNVIQSGLKTGILFTGVFFSLSSGPLLGAVLQMGMIGAERATRFLANRINVILAGVVMLLLLLEAATSGALSTMARYMTFNPMSYWYRTRIWSIVTDDIARNPIFGMNPANWSRERMMSNSIDAEWLVIPLTSGLPAITLLALTFFVMLRPLYLRPDGDLEPLLAGLRRGWTYSFVALIMVGFTVTFYDMMRPQFYAMLAMGSALVRLVALGTEADVPRAAPAAATSGGRQGPVLGALDVGADRSGRP